MSSPITAARSSNLEGNVFVPGDKSLSHRALIISAMAIGTSHISGLLEGEDVLHTAEALIAMGVDINNDGQGNWEVHGVGIGGLKKSDKTIDMGNAGTGVRLLMGLVATYPFATEFTGDDSLRSRPMARVITPLAQMGVQIESNYDNRLPITIKGNDHPMPIIYEVPVPSAQVKSAILLAGLNCPGETTVIESTPTRDHTERMLEGGGANIETSLDDEGKTVITIQGYPELKPQDIDIYGDPSSAAFLVVAALITEGSHIIVKNIGMNPLRTGLYTTLVEMGADITYVNRRKVAGEEVADIEVKSSKLIGVMVPAERAPSMIDEYPILSIAAACAKGKTQMLGLEELKVKESDRLQAIADGLLANGTKIELGEDSLIVHGGTVKGGGTVKTHLDHRIAMSFLVLGLATKEPVTVDDGSMIATSFPNFIDLMTTIGAQIH